MSESLEKLKEKGLAPDFLNESGYQTLLNGYLQEAETPFDMYKRVARAAASYYQKDRQILESKFFDYMWKGWLCPASPVLSNLGTDRGLPISCNSLHVGDSINSIGKKAYELMMLSKNGAGVGIYVGDVRGRGASIKGNGVSEGIIPWCKIFDSVTVAVSQGTTRRGASAVYLPVEHLDAEEFINIRRPVGDFNRRCMNLHHALTITDEWLSNMLAGDKDKRRLWQEILRARVETGEPYLMFTDTVNKTRPESYQKQNLYIKTSNICTEILHFTDENNTFVCCLSSLNLYHYDDWKETDLPEITVRFLDAVQEEYIQKASKIEGLEQAVNSARNERAIGIGVLGWHSLLQKKMLPFDSFQTMMLNSEIFRNIKNKAEKESEQMAIEFGPAPICQKSGIQKRNNFLIAIAPTVSNSIISGGVSASIEPFSANIFSQKSAKGTFIKKNLELEKLLESKKQNTQEVWQQINLDAGSVKNLKFLSTDEKNVFMTAREINQHTLVKLASQRQQFIDQGQSLNLFFTKDADPKYIHEVHIEAWKNNIKTLYYLRSESVLSGDSVYRSKDECVACEG